MKLFSTATILVGSFIIAAPVLADCPGPFLRDVKRAYQEAQTHEAQGKRERALYLYAHSQGSVCEGPNPYEADAAKRAAALALPLGNAAEKKGEWKLAFDLYEAGGHYALADRAFMAATRAKADDPAAFQSARQHFETRSLESFASNHSAALKVTGPYRPDMKLIAEVAAMPTKGFERAAQRELAAFDEQYVRDYVQLIQARADDLTDAAAIQRTISAQQAFVQKWQQQDPLKSSREELRTMRSWGLNSGDEQLAKQAEAVFAQRTEQHAQVLAQKYSSAPKMLEEAMSFVSMQDGQPAKHEARLASLKAQALRLGDDALAKKRYTLAAEYYDAAGDSAKAQAVRDKQSQLAMQKMQPSIDEAQRQAAELQRQFSDPATIQALREQAEAARKNLQQQQAASK
jgi:hypothetical protein